jgi:hypothetical protein
MTYQGICHYTKLKVALEKILPSKKLRLGQMGVTNDPRESKPWTFPIPYTKDSEVNPICNQNVLKALDEVNRVMKEEWKVLCFTLDRSNPDKISEDPIEITYAQYFDPEYARPRMWAQYAENHTGVCLLFDREKLDQNLQRELGERCEIFQGEVVYDPIRYMALSIIPPLPRNLLNDIKDLSPEDAARKYVLEHYQSLFLRKHPDWGSETEYRWLIHSLGNQEEYVSIEGAMKAILVGADFPKVYEPSLRSLCEGLKIPAGRINWESGIPKVEFGSIYQP